ncbi:hypothetical protein ElyMa_006391100 [Elysia marginata]|uniref:Uncharacterized protein n=1 Tax=Elysia marginata TaxID=1093978 RepID=A0AAV4HRH1_9GAST|nr:hypothetical protein ElyMa_006391100 [Elysia marginata]
MNEVRDWCRDWCRDWPLSQTVSITTSGRQPSLPGLISSSAWSSRLALSADGCYVTGGWTGESLVNCFPKAIATWHGRESNPRPPDLESDALTTPPGSEQHSITYKRK